MDTPILLACPHCGRETDSLKQYRMVDLVVVLVVALIYRPATHTACPSCMRRILLKRAAINTITAHLFAPLLYLVYGVYALMTVSQGHSRAIEKEVAADLAHETARM